jgi:hypothetical protein
MTLFDPNNDTNYSPGSGNYSSPEQNYDYSGNQAPKINIKKYLPLIIIGLILLIAGFLVFSWISSQKEINISIVDIDGNPVPGSLTLKDETGKPIEFTPKGKSTKFKANLFPGDYTATVTAENYIKLDNKLITITGTEDDEKTQELTLTRNINATITVALDATKIYESQVIGGKINVSNSGNEFNMNDIIAVSTTPLEVKILPTGITTLQSGGSANLDFEIKIKDASNLTKATPTSVTFKIKGSRVTSQKFDLSAMPTINPNDLVMTGLAETTQNLTAGLQKQYILKFKNNNKSIPLEDLKIEIIADSGYENTLTWINISGAETYTETIIPRIDPGKDQSVIVFVKAPLTASKDDEFRGMIKATSYSLRAEKNFLRSFKVATETKVNLLFKMTPKIFNINCSGTTGVCTGMQKLSNGEAHFENTGSVAIEDITISLDLDAPEATINCPSYFRLFTTKIDKLEAGAKDGTVVVEVMNALASPDTVLAEVCVLEWEYNNPLDPTTRERGKTTIEINKKTN